jgi:hypothetical protein
VSVMLPSQVTPAPLTAIEAALTYGGDFQFDATGDLLTIEDTPTNPAATVQRVIFLILTNPVIENILGTAVSEPDDIFFPKYGAGCRAYVGRPNTLSNVDAIQRNIMDGLLADPFISPNPRPTITITPQAYGSPSALLIQVQFTTISGVNATVPDLLIGPNVLQIGGS